MKSAGVAELKAHLSRYLASVKEGEEVTVTERGRPIARLVPLEGEWAEDPAMLDLVRAGVARPPRKRIDKSFWELPRPKDPEGLVRQALLEERREGR